MIKRSTATLLFARPLFWLLISLFALAFIWLSPLSFVPVPWPDDSAFYLVARDFFHWPPKWVMTSQAPFEPSYYRFNFNTMPLYPILIGIGRFFGIDGSFEIKLWPLLGFALSGFFLSVYTAQKLFQSEAAIHLKQKRLPLVALLLCTFAFYSDPILRWASVLVRPESLIGLCGVLIILSLSRPNAFAVTPITRKVESLFSAQSTFLAIAAYLHFNAVHLVFPVVAAHFWFSNQPIVTLFWIGVRTAILLLPWIIIILSKLTLFTTQMTTQWKRLAVGNDWLSTPQKAISGLLQNMGSPAPWHPTLDLAAIILWVLIFIAIALFIRQTVLTFRRAPPNKYPLTLASAAWVLSALWLWTNKPEVWFVYYIHLAIFALIFSIIAENFSRLNRIKPIAIICAGLLGLFTITNVSQLSALSNDQTFTWSAYQDWIGCIDQQLIKQEALKKSHGKFRVWAPTFPDILVELAKRHPDWEFTRTCDFHDRWKLAWEHGKKVDAFVITESINNTTGRLEGPQGQFPNIQSVWMNWKGYYINHFQEMPDWMHNDRYYCQVGRWQAFLYLKSENPTPTP